MPKWLLEVDATISGSGFPGSGTSRLAAELSCVSSRVPLLTHPADILQAVRQSLCETGRLVLVEFRSEDPDVPILPLHKMGQVQVMKEIAANGLKLVGQFDEPPWQHVFFFARNDASVPVVQLIPWIPKVSIEANASAIPVASHSSPPPAASMKSP